MKARGERSEDKVSEKNSFDKLIAGSSVDSSMCSIIDNHAQINNDPCDFYNQSVLVSTMVKEPEDLIDKDLMNLLSYIKKLQFPSEEQIKTK